MRSILRQAKRDILVCRIAREALTGGVGPLPGIADPGAAACIGADPVQQRRRPSMLLRGAKVCRPAATSAELSQDLGRL